MHAYGERWFGGIKMRNKLALRVLFLALGLLIGPLHAHASGNCDPNLFKDVSNYQANTSIWLSYIDNLSRYTDQDSKQGIGVSYAGIGLSWNEAKSVADFIRHQTQYQMSVQQMTSLVRSTISGNGLTAYLGCIGANRGVTIEIPDAAASDPGFAFTGEWDPKFVAPESVLTLKTVNGEILGGNEYPIKATQSRNFILTNRDLSKTLFVAAEVNGQADIVSLPAVPNFVTKLRRRATPQGHYEASTGSNSIQVRLDGVFTAQELYMEPLK
jgi:hypothetical protein